LRASSYSEEWTDAAVRRFAKNVGEALEDLLDLSRADITSKHMEKVIRGLRQIDLLAERVAGIKAFDSKPTPLPKGLGTAIIERFGIQPGPALGALMKQLQSEVETGRLGVQKDYDHYLAYIEKNSLLPEHADKEKGHDEKRSI
jgi:poly(A) polymerase